MDPTTQKKHRRPGAGRPKKYATEEERRRGYLERHLRYNRKLENNSERVVAYLGADEARNLEEIMARKKLPSKAAAIRWLIGRHAAD